MKKESKKKIDVKHHKLKRSLSLLKATLESTADGILVVDMNGSFASYNKKFAQMWGIPEIVLKNKDDKKAISYVLSQLKDPEGFIEKLQQLYAEPSLNCFDEIEFSDGRKSDWVVLRNRLSSLLARNKEEMQEVLEKLSQRIGFRLASGFGERVIFRELFLSGLTLLDLPDIGLSLSLSHVAARQELRDLLEVLKLPTVAEKLRLAG